MLVGLRQAQVPAAGYIAFVVAAPVLDPVLFGALAIIAGLETALIYAGIAFVAAMGLALLAEHRDIERHLTPIETLLGIPTSNSSCEPTCEDAVAEGWRGLREEVPRATRSATSLLAGIAPILLVGIVISILIEAAVPPDVIERLTSASPALSIPIAALLGTPLYVSTAVFVPIADALTSVGVGVGVIVALTIAGAGANLPEFVILSRRPVLGSSAPSPSTCSGSPSAGASSPTH